MRAIHGAAAALLFVLASACQASYQNVPMPAAGSPPAPGESRIYLARSAQFWGKVRRVEVIDSGEVVGSIDRKGFLCWDRPAERIPIQIHYHGAVLDDGVVEGLLDFDGQPGEVHYYEVHLRPSDRHPEIRELSAKEGAALLADRRPAKGR